MPIKTKRNKNYPSIIPRQSTELSSAIGEVLERSVGRYGMHIMYNMGPEKYLLNGTELIIADNAKMSLERNRLILENVMVITLLYYSMND